MGTRRDGREPGDLRPISFTRDYTEMAAGSGHGSEDGLADLDRQLRELELVEAA